MKNWKIGILIWDSVEPLDFCGPYEVFQAAASLLRKKDLIQLAEETGLPNYIILNNKFLGMNLTFSLLWSEKGFN